MTLNEFISEYEGKTVGYPTNDQYKGECLSLVKWYIKKCFNIDPPPSGCNAARCYWSIFPNPLGTVFKKVAETPDLIPEPGWIAVWDENAGAGFGHIAIVLEATINKFTSLDQNWNSKSAQRTGHYYKNIYGYLAPISTTTGSMPENDNIELPKIKFEELVKKSTWYDENFEKFGEQARELEAKKRTIDDLKNDFQSYLDSLSKLLWEKQEPTIADKEAIKEKITNIASEVQEAKNAKIQLEDSYQRLQTEKAQMELKYTNELIELKKEIDQMKIDHEKELENVSKRVDIKIQELEAQKKQYEATTRFFKWLGDLLPFLRKEK